MALWLAGDRAFVCSAASEPNGIGEEEGRGRFATALFAKSGLVEREAAVGYEVKMGYTEGFISGEVGKGSSGVLLSVLILV